MTAEDLREMLLDYARSIQLATLLDDRSMQDILDGGVDEPPETIFESVT